MFRRLTICVSLSVVLWGCGEKAREMKEAIDNAKALTENASKIEEKTNEITKRRDERKAHGDTLAIPYKDLQKFLPDNVGGYKSEDPTGESIDAMGMSYSTAKRSFTRDNGDHVDIELVDYNQNPGMYEGLTALWGLGYKVDNDRETMKSFDTQLPYSSAIEHYYKQDKNAELIYALGGRFILTIKASNQPSIDFVKNVANSMKLNDLSNK